MGHAFDMNAMLRNNRIHPERRRRRTSETRSAYLKYESKIRKFRGKRFKKEKVTKVCKMIALELQSENETRQQIHHAIVAMLLLMGTFGMLLITT